MWKEYRVQRAFWLCIAILVVLLICLAHLTLGNDNDRLFWQFGIALILPAFYAAACGGLLFATEYEADTYEFQRSLPLSPIQLLWGKCAFAVAGIVAMYAIAWCTAALLSGMPLGAAIEKLPAWALLGRLDGRGAYIAMAPGAGSVLLALELFLWSVLFSLLLRRPLTAALVGASAAAVAFLLMPWQKPSHEVGNLSAAALSARLVVVAILAALDVRFGLRWLGEQRIASAMHMPALRRSAHVAAPLQAQEWTRAVARLAWQNWRQARGLLLALGAMCLPLGVISVLAATRPANDSPYYLNENIVFALIAALLALAAVPLSGATAFLSDQQGSGYRFLADRGIRPSYLWLSRQLPVWFLGILLALGFSAVVAAFGPVLVGNTNWYAHFFAGSALRNIVAAIFSLALVGVAAGQFCSMIFRGGLVAAFFAVLLTGIFVLWYALMWLWGVNWFWSVLPIPLALLLATWLRTPHWLVERNTLRAWLPAILAVVVPAAALLTAVPLYRVYSIPAVDPGFTPEDHEPPMTAAEKATLDLYEQAWQQFKPIQAFYPKGGYVEERGSWQDPNWPPRRAWVEANQKVIPMVLEASRKTECNFFGARFEISQFFQARSEEGIPAYFAAYQLAELLVYSAFPIEEKGELDAAMERYLAAIRISLHLRHYAVYSSEMQADQIEHDVYERLKSWARRPGQTPARIRAAASDLQKLTANLPPDFDSLKHKYVRVRRELLGGYDAIIAAARDEGRDYREFSRSSLTWLWSRLPWERARAMRLLNWLTRRQFDELTHIYEAAQPGKAIPRPPEGPYRGPRELDYALREEIRLPPLEGPTVYEQEDRIRRYAAAMDERRVIRRSLLLQAWTLQHASPPKYEELDQPDN